MKLLHKHYPNYKNDTDISAIIKNMVNLSISEIKHQWFKAQ